MMKKLLGCYLKKTQKSKTQWNKEYNNTGETPATRRATITPLYSGKARLNNEKVEVNLWIEMQYGDDKELYLEIKGKENEKTKEDILNLL